MSGLLAVDPGIDGCGVACFRDGVLVAAAHVKNPAGTRVSLGRRVEDLAGEVWSYAAQHIHIDQLALELMQVYQGSKQKGDPNDLIKLAVVAGALQGFYCGEAPATYYTPREWKGQVDPPAMFRRIIKRLSDEERAAVEGLEGFDPAKGKTQGTVHNALDAVGIGLKHLGRL